MKRLIYITWILSALLVGMGDITSMARIPRNVLLFMQLPGCSNVNGGHIPLRSVPVLA
ncbi:MAG: hypothetical protein HQ553_12990 [Chloroflexi bacterium]|nr:hypothetical protein [Chloroflexota bacterium]